MLTVFACPSFLRVLENITSPCCQSNKKHGQKKRSRTYATFKLMLDVAGLAAQVAVLVIFTARTHHVYGSAALTVLLPVCSAVLSFSWWPNFVQKFPALAEVQASIKEEKVNIITS